jgi:hypothetical protein
MKLMAILTLFCLSTAFAGPVSKIDVKKIDALASNYFLQKYQQKKQNLFETLARVGTEHVPPGCDPYNPPPNSNECVDAVCDRLGVYGCDEQSEITSVIQACRGVDGDCVEASCKRLGAFGCDEMSEIRNVTDNCRQVFDGRCMDVVCGKLGVYGCDEMSEIRNVGEICKGRVDSGCIESVCKRLGVYGCDEVSEIRQVAKSCGGN